MVAGALFAAVLAAAPAAVAAPAPGRAAATHADPIAATSVRTAARLEFPASPTLPAVPVMNPHDEGGKPYCAWCHEGRNPAVKGGDPVALCTQCHEPSIMKHPYGVAAKQVPAALPLAGGKIVCHTCHDPHDVKAHRKGLRLDYMPLCAQCHAGHGGHHAEHAKAAAPAPAPAHR